MVNTHAEPNPSRRREIGVLVLDLRRDRDRRAHGVGCAVEDGHEVVANEVDQGAAALRDSPLDEVVILLHGRCCGLEVIGEKLAVADDVGV